MRPSAQQYSEIPVEDKLDGVELEIPARTSRWSKKVVVGGILAAILVTVLLVVSLGSMGREEPIQTTTNSSPLEDPDWLAHATKATGDTYLIGVGKADITGYVQ